MIRRVDLTGWKAFDSLTFEPGAGVTFVIARNGTGKSSLLDGISWGTFGDRSGIDPTAMARAGSPATQVVVELDGPDHKSLRIERSLGAPVRATLGESALSAEELDDALRTIFGANLDFAARATTLGHSSLFDHARSFEHLDSHLADVFGITHLRSATEAIEDAYNTLKRTNSKLRAATRAQPDVVALRQRSAELAAELDDLVAQRPDAQSELDAANEVQREADEARRAAEASARWQEASVGLSARVDEIVGPGNGHLPERVEAALARIEGTISTITRMIGAAEASIVAAESSLESLATPGALCPTCRRPLSDHERSAARQEHGSIVAVATSETQAAQDQLDQATQDRDRLRELLRNVERLGPAPHQPPIVATSAEVGVALEHAQAQMRDLERGIGERQGALSEIERVARSASADAEAEAERQRAIRREAVAQLAASVMRSTVDELMEQRVGPIADEVSARWKQVFGDRGTLRMSQRGEISMERGGHLIPFSSFSPGEQVVSMLALRFLTVAASTTSPFMLLDEPLECLDPPNRRLIASVLVGTDRPVGQMIVTTYEEALVRRIHATIPDTDVRVIS